MKNREHGVFCISLDTELIWGMLDSPIRESYAANVINGRNIVVPRMLELFQKRGIHATWAVVGLLFAHDEKQLRYFSPSEQLWPTYDQPQCSPYRILDSIGKDETEDQCYLYPDLIDRIRNTPGQFVGSHTFCHYYCEEPGQTREQFEADMRSAVRIAETQNVTLRSIVFPRNQVVKDYLPVCEEAGITAYRGIEENWIYNKTKGLLCRLLRFADSYLPISGPNTYFPEQEGELLNLRGSRFLRPYHPKLRVLEWLKLRRIKGQMLNAARERKIFHLWWHPHNFGANIEENFSNLLMILDYYEELNREYGFTSMAMEEIAEKYGD